MFKFSVVFSFVFFSVVGFSQTKKITDVNKDIDLVKIYIQVVKEGYGTPQIYKELANGYYFRSNYTESKKWFEKLFDSEKITDETLLYRYKQSLKALGVFLENNTYLAISGTN